MNGPQHSSKDFGKSFESAFGRLQVAILEACAQEEAWSAKVAAGVRVGFELAASDPAGAQVLINEALASGREGLERHERLIAYLEDRLLPGRAERPDGKSLPAVTERAMAGGVVALVAQRIDQGREGELAALAPEAIQFILTPYLGAGEARRLGAESRLDGADRP
jgi:hypothetical protein